MKNKQVRSDVKFAASDQKNYFSSFKTDSMDDMFGNIENGKKCKRKRCRKCKQTIRSIGTIELSKYEKTPIKQNKRSVSSVWTHK